MNSLTWVAVARRAVPQHSSSEGYLVWISGAALLVALSTVTSQNVTPTEIAYAGVLLAMCIQAYLSWRKGNQISIPVWALVCAAHFVFYGLAIFGALRTSPSMFDHGSTLPDSVLATAMLVGVISIVSIGIGRFAALHLAKDGKLPLPLLETRSHAPVRILVLLVLGIAANLFGVPFSGTIAWNISVTTFSMLPLTAFLWVVLGRGIRRLPWLEFWLAIVFLATRVMSGTTFNATLGTIVIPLYLMSLAALATRRRFPWRMIAVVTCIVFFLQPAKSTVRAEMFRGRLGRGVTDAMVRWIEVASSGWEEVFSGRKALDDQLSPTASRSSLLTMTGLILEKTPETVPFQFGAYYPLLFKNLIPRVLWAEKPSVNVANQFFQLNYGLTDRERLASVSIACGFEAEGYMNFGWYGILVVGLVVGFVLGTYERAFFAAGSGRTAIAIGLAMLPGFLTIESQLVQYLGGILQFALAAFIVFHQTKGKTVVLAPFRGDRGRMY